MFLLPIKFFLMRDSLEPTIQDGCSHYADAQKGHGANPERCAVASSVPAQASQQKKDYLAKDLENRDSSNASHHVLVEKMPR